MGRRGIVSAAVAAAIAVGTLAGCKSSTPTAPGASKVRVNFVYLALTTRRPDLPASAETCARFVGPTHVHPSWRNFEPVSLNPVGTSRWELALDDVPVGTRLSIQVADQNACIEDPAGWVTRDVFANDVALTQVVTVASGKGLAFTVAADGRVTP